MITNLQLEDQPHLLALDLGLRFGWACYTDDARLIAYGSHHCAKRAKLKSIAWSTLSKLPTGSEVYIEGGGVLLDVWCKEARRRQVICHVLHAERWRADCLLPRDQQSGASAKRKAQTLSRTIITTQSGQAPISLRHDTAEATLMGWWALYQSEWISPTEFKQGLSLA